MTVASCVEGTWRSHGWKGAILLAFCAALAVRIFHFKNNNNERNQVSQTKSKTLEQRLSELVALGCVVVYHRGSLRPRVWCCNYRYGSIWRTRDHNQE